MTAPSGSDPLQHKLEVFAKTTIASINRNILPSSNKKQVTQNGDGTFTARYLEIDPASVRTSYKPSDSSAVSHIGYMTYDEVEYSCTATSQKDAQAGPFKGERRTNMTELVKCVKGNWTY